MTLISEAAKPTSIAPDGHILNPLAQPGVVWHLADCQDLPPVSTIYPIRYSDPGGALQLVANRYGPPTSLCVLGDNIAGVSNWQDLSLKAQYRAVAEGTGAFPCGGMYYLSVRGPEAGRALDMLTPKDITRLRVGRAIFAVFTTPHGTVDTEAIVLRVGAEDYLVSVGGRARVPTWLGLALTLCPGAIATEANISTFNLKGPGQVTAMLRLLHPGDHHSVRNLAPFSACQARDLNGDQLWILRTKIGMEMWAGPASISNAWNEILQRPDLFTPCGWDVLAAYRLECEAMVFGLCPLDMHAETTLAEVGLAQMIRVDKKADYIGREALLAMPARRRLWLGGLAAVDSSSAAAAVGDAIVGNDGEIVGYVTTSAWSPKHGRALSFAHLSTETFPGEVVRLANDSEWMLRTLPFD